MLLQKCPRATNEHPYCSPTMGGFVMCQRLDAASRGVFVTQHGRDGWTNVFNGKPSVGQVAERSRTTKMQDIHSFTDMSVDRNPVHYDEELAKRWSLKRSPPSAHCGTR
jgi:hypothetical protein